MFILLLNEDTTTVDSTRVYAIPEVIHHGLPAHAVQLPTEVIEAQPYDFDVTDALLRSPLALFDLGYGQLNRVSRKGLDPRHTALFLNNHRIESPLFGYLNLASLPIQFFETLALDEEYLGPACLNLVSKIDRYPMPFSRIRFSTGDFGQDMYNVDFARQIIDDFGFYLSGLYWDSQRDSFHAGFEMNAVYANVYDNHILPMRCDIVYSSNTYEAPTGLKEGIVSDSGNNAFADICLTGGFKRTTIALYTTVNNCRLNGTQTLDNNTTTYGLDITAGYDIMGCGLVYRATGALSALESDVYGSSTVPTLRALLAVNKVKQPYAVSLTQCVELYDNSTTFYAPSLSLGLDIYDSTFFFGSIARNYRMPSRAEKFPAYELYEPCGTVRGNPELRPEHFWSMECGIKRDNSAVTLFRRNHKNMIMAQPDSAGYQLENIDSWSMLGLEALLEIPVYVNAREHKNLTGIYMQLSGMHLFYGDSLPCIPENNAGMSLSLKRDTERFGMGCALQAQFVGQQRSLVGEDRDPYAIYSIRGSVRFVTLSFLVRLNNIFDNEYFVVSDYRGEPRNFDFTVAWEFWD